MKIIESRFPSSIDDHMVILVRSDVEPYPYPKRFGALTVSNDRARDDLDNLKICPRLITLRPCTAFLIRAFISSSLAASHLMILFESMKRAEFSLPRSLRFSAAYSEVKVKKKSQDYKSCTFGPECSRE